MFKYPPIFNPDAHFLVETWAATGLPPGAPAIVNLCDGLAFRITGAHVSELWQGRPRLIVDAIETWIEDGVKCSIDHHYDAAAIESIQFLGGQ